MRRAGSAKTTAAQSKNRPPFNLSNTSLLPPIPPTSLNPGPLEFLVSGARTQYLAAMASSNTVSKPIQKILDSTKVATLSKFIRKPLIDPQTPIQGRPREPSSNAYKEHQNRESHRLRKALDSVAHGKHIFAYHNVRTNQVVYSLTRYLEVSFLQVSRICCSSILCSLSQLSH